MPSNRVRVVMCMYGALMGVCVCGMFVGLMRLSRSGKLKKIMLNLQIRMLKLLTSY